MMFNVSKKMVMLMLCMLVICVYACGHLEPVTDRVVFKDIDSVSEYLAKDIQLKFNEYMLKEEKEKNKEAEEHGEPITIRNKKPSIIVTYFMTLQSDKRNMCCKRLETYIRGDLPIIQAIDCDKLKQISRYFDLPPEIFKRDYATRGLMADARFIVTARLDLQKNNKKIFIILDCRETLYGTTIFSSRVALSFRDKDIQEAWNTPAPFCEFKVFADKSQMVSAKETGRGKDKYSSKIAAEVLVKKAFVEKYVRPWIEAYTLLTKDEVESIVTIERLQGWVPLGIKYRILNNEQGTDGLWSATVIGEMSKIDFNDFVAKEAVKLQQTQPIPFIQNFN